MNLTRKVVLEKILSGLDAETRPIFTLAESICRREYEKAFILNLVL